MTSDTRRPPDEDSVAVDEEGAEAAERAGGEGAMSRQDSDGTADDERPDSATGGSGSGGAGEISPAAGNTVGGRDR